MATRARDALQARSKLIDSPFWTAFLISPEVILIHKPDGTILEANPAAQEKLGYSIEEMEGMNILDIVIVTGAEMQERAKKVSTDGELSFRAVHRRKDGSTFESEVRTRAVNVEGEDLIVGIGLDITDQRLAEMLNVTLERMSSFLGSRMDFDRIMQATVRMAKEAIGSDSAIIVLRDGEDWKLIYQEGFSRYARTGSSFATQQSSAAAMVRRTGKVVVVNDVTHDPRMNREFASHYGIDSLLMAPLKAKGDIVGIIGFFGHGRTKTFTDTHVDFASKLAYSISLLLETARVSELERTTDEFLRKVVETVPDAIMVLNMEGQFTFANNEAERILGVPKEEILKRRYDDPRWRLQAINGKDLPPGGSSFSLILRGAPSVHGSEMMITRPDGRDVAVSVNMLPILSPAGKQEGAVLSMTDTTERRNAQEQLERDKTELTTLMETTPSGIILMDQQGRIVFMNRSAEEILRVERGEAIGRMYDDPEWSATDYEGRPYPPEKLPFRMVMDGGNPVYGVRHAVLGSSGHRIMLQENAAPLFDQEGNVSAVIISMEDVTTMISTEKALRISMRTSNDIIQQMPSGILLFQYRPPDGLVLASVNPTADAILGGLEGKVGQDFDQIWRKGAFFATKEEFLEVMKTGQTLWREGVHYSDLSVDGNFTFRAFYLPENRLCINFDDVTERIREERLRRDAFEQIERNIEHFATLVDRIRNPLSAIIAQTESGGQDRDRILRRAAEIEFILTQLDMGWLQSERVRDFLKKTL